MSDQELEEVTFNVVLASAWWNNPPSAKVWLNDELIENTKVSEKREDKEQKIISFSRQLSEGEHTITVELYKKTWDETVVDGPEATKVIKDQLLFVEDIEIDEISLGHILYTNSKFYTDRKWHPDLPEVLTEMTSLGYNGRLELKFQVPTYIWFLENL